MGAIGRGWCNIEIGALLKRGSLRWDYLVSRNGLPAEDVDAKVTFH